MVSQSEHVCSPFLPHLREACTERASTLLQPYLQARSLESGQHLWRQGDTEGQLVLLRSGRVKVYRSVSSGKEVTLYVFEPGTLFGFTPFLSGTEYPASAVALGPCEVHVASKSRLLEAIADNPDIAMLLLRHLNMRLEEAFATIERLSTKGTVPKVAAALAGLLREERDNSSVIELPTTSAEVAQSLGITPETFSRSISNLVKSGVLHRLGRNRFQVLDARKLREIGRTVGW